VYVRGGRGEGEERRGCGARIFVLISFHLLNFIFFSICMYLNIFKQLYLEIKCSFITERVKCPYI
jgi:hypothetical protein